MANHTTGAQRYNNRMDKIFDRAKSEGRGLVGNSKTDGVGVNSPAMKKARAKALEKASKGHKHNEREVRAKKLGYYPHGHKNFGDVYEA